MSNAKRFAVPIVLWIVALALLVVGLLAVSVWKPEQEVVAERDSNQPYTMTRAGVLPLYADKVEVRASGEPDQIVWLVVGQPDDVSGWLEEEPYDEVVGLSDITTLKAVTHVPEDYEPEEPQSGDEPEEADEGEVAQSGEVVSPLDSDMWTAVKYGRGSVSMILTGSDLDMSVIAASDGDGPAPTLQLKWETPQDNHLALIAFVAAAAAFLLGVILALLLAASRAKRVPKVTVIDAAQDDVDTKMLEIVDADSKDQDFEEEAEEPSTGDVTAEEVVTGEAAAEEPPADEAVSEETVTEEAVTEEPVTEETVTEEPEPSEEKVDEEAARAAEDAEAKRRREETVTTESGMMNLSALQSGGAFPTRRALREARERGIDTLVVEGAEYSVDPGAKGDQKK